MTALAEVHTRTDSWWLSCAEKALGVLVAQPLPFTASDLTDLGVPDPDVPARWGSFFAAAKARGQIIPAGYRPSPRKSRNGGTCMSWVGIPRQPSTA